MKKTKTFKSLKDSHPSLVKEWDYYKNNLLKKKNGESINPETVSNGSYYNVWWKCSDGHEWQQKIYLRTQRKNKCPYCKGRIKQEKSKIGIRNIKEEDLFANVHPELLKEWFFEKNDKLSMKNGQAITPYTVSKSSNYKVWWRCEATHHLEINLFLEVVASVSSALP